MAEEQRKALLRGEERRKLERRIYKTSEGAMLAGVCAGLAEYLNVDVTLVRLGFILVALAGGAGVLGYIVAAIVMPDKWKVTDHRQRERTMSSFDQPTQQSAPFEPAGSEAERASTPPKQQSGPEIHRGRDQQLLALVFIAVGGYMLIGRFFDLHDLLGHWWPLLIVLLGVGMLGNSFTHRG